VQDEYSLTHSVWEYKYHIVWISKYRRKKLYGELRKYLEAHLCPDHIHTWILEQAAVSIIRSLLYL
jgi:putative transposase